MGGTFNPIHIGHLILAEQAYEQFELDYVLFMPSKRPPHKPNQELESDIHRKKMVELSIQDNSHFMLSTLELERDGTTYTVDTMRELNEDDPDTDYYFIIGGDSLFQLETWREPAEIMKFTHILAASRYHIPNQEIQNQIDYLKKTYQGRISLLEIPTIDISSKMLRQSLQTGKSVTYYIKEPVIHYIMQHRLYQ